MFDILLQRQVSNRLACCIKYSFLLVWCHYELHAAFIVQFNCVHVCLFPQILQTMLLYEQVHLTSMLSLEHLSGLHLSSVKVLQGPQRVSQLNLVQEF